MITSSLEKYYKMLTNSSWIQSGRQNHTDWTAEATEMKFGTKVHYQQYVTKLLPNVSKDAI